MGKTYKLLYVVVLCVVIALTAVFVGCKTTTAAATETTAAATETTAAATETTAAATETTAAATETTAAAGKVRTTAEREDVTATEPVSPKGVFPEGFLTGIKDVGVIPLKKYFIAFSNGDMGDVWRKTFVQDMDEWGKKYVDKYGIKWVWSNSGNDSAKQLGQAESLVAQKPDILVISPNETEALTPILDTAAKANIPVIALDRELKADPGTGIYKSILSMDYYLNGVADGAALVEQLTKKYGSPKGNVVELTGILGSSPGIQRSQGIRWVLKDYPDIRIIESRDASFDRQKGYTLMKDLLQTYKAGEIDAVVCGCDATGLGALQAIKEAGRNELLGYINGVDGDTAALEGILSGEYGSSHECSPYYGLPAFEYIIRYLNGEDIPTRIMMPTRWYYIDDDPVRKEALQKLVDYSKQNNLPFPPMFIGGQKELTNPVKYYDKPWYEDKSKQDIEPFTTQSPIKITK
ncbi:MAG: substrate-binding domain-containing protein [Actinobacteria bacterium]|nr:substrate-binding domain-containing protein [Actinomycetota bacterium]